MKKFLLTLMFALAAVIAFSQTTCTSYHNTFDKYNEYTKLWERVDATDCNIKIEFDDENNTIFVASSKETVYHTYGENKTPSGVSDEGEPWEAIERHCYWYDKGSIRKGDSRLIRYKDSGRICLVIFYWNMNKFYAISYWLTTNN